MLQVDSSTNTAPSARPAYETHAGLHLLRIAGDDYEMGYQHGALLKEAIPRGPLPYFERYVERMLGTGFGGGLGKALSHGLSHTVGRKIALGFPEHAKRALAGLADGAGLSKKNLLSAVTMPESYLWVLQQLLRFRMPRLAPHHGVPLLGCTSAVAWGAATEHGRMLHGRNFDYQGVGAWDTEQAIVFHRPKDGQPYVSLSAAGVLFGGITAMNSSGLSLVVHQHMASDALALGGTPIGITGDLIMRHARNLDDAKRMLDEDTPSGCWTYVITSAADQAALFYETTPGRKAALPQTEGVAAYSNVYLDRALSRTERELYPSHWRNNLARYRRARALLEERRGHIDENVIAGILGNPGRGCRFEEAISVVMTVASVVFDPELGRMWVGTGRAPTSNNEYVAFDLATESVAQLPPLTGGKLDAGSHGAFEHYRQAYEAYFNADDLKAAREHLQSASQAAPDQPLYFYMQGLMALLDRDASGALKSFDRAIALSHDAPERIASFHLWRGRAQDLLGQREAALSNYRDAQRGDPLVEKAAKRGLRRPYRGRRFGVEFTLADVPMP
ncbi:MAG TPA: C45 family autoproteolytic acyltransferase/hydrolase [Polyangiaceae bacterium]|nr:C45 family autoproteolytic acyltransferase/hydrolase [Polyangiaceae bacterium]